MRRLFVNALAGALALATALSAAAADWPSWRGPDGTGITPEQNLPREWSAQKNIRWRTPLPGPGNSSPIVWGDRVFVTQATKADSRRELLCFDRNDGKLLWHSGVAYTEKEPTHQTNPYCAATPVTDGERVIASFGSAGLYCYDFAGKELWRRDFGKMTHVFGNASSPILHGELCFFPFGPDEKNARLIAVNKKTGKTVWEVPPPPVDPSEQAPAAGGPGAQPKGPQGGKKKGGSGGSMNLAGSFSTPLVIQAGGREELIMNFANRLCAYDPATGRQLWISKGMGSNIFVTPVWGEGVLVTQSSGREGGRVIAIRPGGSGDVTEKILWKLDKSDSRIGSGVIHQGHVYLVSDTAAECLDLQTGKTVWKEALKGPGARKAAWSSMLLSGDVIYVPNQSGDVFVLRAAPRFELLGVNSVGEPTNASLAPSNGELFMRTDKSLLCIAAPKGQ